jgi:hypothetical protein
MELEILVTDVLNQLAHHRPENPLAYIRNAFVLAMLLPTLLASKVLQTALPSLAGSTATSWQLRGPESASFATSSKPFATSLSSKVSFSRRV